MAIIASLLGMVGTITLLISKDGPVGSGSCSVHASFLPSHVNDSGAGGWSCDRFHPDLPFARLHRAPVTVATIV